MPVRVNPLPKIVQEAISSNTYTPDVLKMTYMFHSVPVFVTGTEKERFFEHKDALGELTPVGYGTTQKPSFVMYSHRKTKFPVVMYNPANPAAARVHGELYMIPIYSLLKLDSFHQNTIFTSRGWRPVRIYDAKESGGNQAKRYYDIDSIMYTGHPRYIELRDYDELRTIGQKDPFFMWTVKDDEKAKHTPIVPW